MNKSTQLQRTTDELLELAREHAPQDREELAILLREVTTDLQWLREELQQPPESENPGRLIARIQVDTETLIRKCQQLTNLLDKLWDRIPD
jgi:hypothetical protein